MSVTCTLYRATEDEIDRLIEDPATVASGRSRERWSDRQHRLSLTPHDHLPSVTAPGLHTRQPITDQSSASPKLYMGPDTC